MNSFENTKTSKSALVAVGVLTFVIGLIFAAAFSSFFSTRYVPFAVFVGAIVFLVFRFKNGSCCSR